MGNKAKAAVMEEIVLINIFFSSSLFNVNAQATSSRNACNRNKTRAESSQSDANEVFRQCFSTLAQQ